MGLFSSGRKLKVDKDYSLADIPLFAALSAQERELIEKRARLREFKKGDTVYKQGDPPDAFYVIITGRFRVFLTRGEHEISRAYLHRNDYFGEISLLTDKPHSVTIQAKNDAIVLRLEKRDFDHILKEVPSLSLHFSRLLGGRLVARDLEESHRKGEEAKIVSTYTFRSEGSRSTFTLDLAAVLTVELHKSVLIVDMHLQAEGPAKRAPVDLSELNVQKLEETRERMIKLDCGCSYVALSARQRPSNAELEKKVTAFLAFVISHFDFVLVDLPQEIDELSMKALTQSDAVYVVVDSERASLERARSFFTELKKTFGFTQDEVRLVLRSTSDRTDPISTAKKERITGQKVFVALPYIEPPRAGRDADLTPVVLADRDSRYAHVLRYVGRELGGALVGLALGSGAAFGLAHIGVLKVLEREKIPVDIVAGSSIGALIGVLWAGGVSAEAIEKLALSFNLKNTFFRLVGISDLAFGLRGFLRGRKIMRLLKSLLPCRTFEELAIPLRVVATNLFTSESVVFEEGDLLIALRASISIPGIMTPVHVDNKILIDGGISDPLPVNVLAKEGVKKIIAVNVLPAAADYEERKEAFRRKREEYESKILQQGTVQAWWYRNAVRPFQKYMADNIFNVLMCTVQFMEYGMAQAAAAGADVVIHAVLADSHWAEFYSARRFIQLGEARAREALSEIHHLVSEI